MSARFTIEIEKMAHGGVGLGHHDGKVVFVAYTAPGDIVEAEVETEKTGWSRARLVRVIEPSPVRQVAPCPHFGPDKCGGCHWQHLQYSAQLANKQAVVSDQLVRLGGMDNPPVGATLSVGPEWEYRNHVQLHPSPQGLGYIAATGDSVYALDTCPLMHPLVAELMEIIDVAPEDFGRVGLRASLSTGGQLVILETSEEEAFEAEVDLPVSCVLLFPDGSWLTLAGRDSLVERVAGRDYRISAGSFFQINTIGAQALVDVVTEYVDPHPYENLLELYAGVGLFSLALADRAAHVIAVEAYAPAATDAQFNVSQAGVDNVEVICDQVDAALQNISTPVDSVIVDPPRAGCGSQVLQQLLVLKPRKLVYVACDPAALARDARTLTAQGYDLKQVQPLDMFPQTYHIETVALFTRGT